MNTPDLVTGKCTHLTTDDLPAYQSTCNLIMIVDYKSKHEDERRVFAARSFVHMHLENTSMEFPVFYFQLLYMRVNPLKYHSADKIIL